MSDSGDERFDGLLMNMAQTQRGIEPLLESVFSFLRRKTDFFSGASPAVVEQTVLAAVRKQATLAEKDQYHKKQKEVQRRQKQEQVKKTAPEPSKVKAKTPEPEPTPRFEEVTDEEATAIEQKAEASTDKTNDGEDDETPLVGNGGTTDKYVWTQTLQEAQVSYPVAEGTKSRQVDVSITASRLRVGLKGGETFTNGQLFNKVKVDDSFWTLEDGNRICIYLQKENQMEWWKCIVQGDPEIDTKKVQPENSKLADLDSDTRQTVEKMMFDQRQKALGLPTSDDMQKQEILQKFMAQHPEMDFSNAKIN